MQGRHAKEGNYTADGEARKGASLLEGIERPKALEKLKETLAPSNYYYFNPEFDKKRLRS